MRTFQFAGMLRKYNRPYTLVRLGKTEKYDDYGDPVPSQTERITHFGHIQPVDAKLQQVEGGRYTAEDRALYTVSEHQSGDLIEYQGIQYTVDAPEPRDYSDVNKYILKKVIANDPVQ
ncbi:hypothetical protein ACTHPF_20525 [Paenibacillus sp. SAF-054]|uniref:hypothetical protein n=1 Tax=unclassified Paenibacillus TaxID=185978 RepID=UPI003F7ED7AF